MELDWHIQWTTFLRGTEEVFPQEELRAKLARALETKQPLRIKLGVDPTGTDLHLGHVIPVLKMQQLQKLGHHCILIVGDYTAMVGDPSGQNTTRPQLTHDQVMENCRTYQDQLFQILDPEKTEVVYNGSWFEHLGFSDVMQLMAQMTVARMLEREDFAQRYRSHSPISLHELLYPLMQGYDSAMIKADVELGGIDQRFNILVGRDIQRDHGQECQVGVCNPILLGTDGQEKMSKSLGNYIGINETPEDMFGKTMSIPDQLIIPYFELITEVPDETIRSLKDDLACERLHPKKAKEQLAYAVTERFHGPDGAAQGAAHFQRVFAERELPEDIPLLELDTTELNQGTIWIAALVEKAGFAATRSEARRLVQQGAVKLDGEVITDTSLDWPVRDQTVLQVGKRRFARIQKKDAPH